MIMWKPIPGYEGLYEISACGAVRSLDREITHYTGKVYVRRGRPLLHTFNGRYMQVNLSKAGRTKTHTVHVLVALAFFGPRPTGEQVRHLKGDIARNGVGDLAYGTPVQNAADMAEHGRKALGERHGRAKLTDEAVATIRSLRGEYTHRELAEAFGVSVAQIGNIIYGRQRKSACQVTPNSLSYGIA